LDGSRFHRQADARNVAKSESWDRVFAFPPCTRLASSGARWFAQYESEQNEAVTFFMFWTQFPGAIENPIGIMSRLYRKPDQIVQPWMFGHGETKATCFWLNRLPLLTSTKTVLGREPRVHYESPGIRNGLSRAQRRSIFLPGIADAMAEQWGIAA
jgi:hypothetical protein